MYSGNTCDAPWSPLSAGRELANALEDVLQGGISAACPEELSGAAGGLADLADAQFDAASLAELAKAAHRQVARFQALEILAMAEYRRRRRADDWGPYWASETDRFITQELSAAMAVAPASIDASLGLGADLQERLPEILEAMLSGGADFAKVKAIGELTRTITDPDNLAAVRERAVQWARNCTSTRLRHNVRRLIKKLEPEAVAERKKRSVAMRSLQLWDNEDETATLAGINLDPALAGRAYDRINRLAKARRTAGDERSLDNLRADTLIGLILGTGPQDTTPGSGSPQPGGPDTPGRSDVPGSPAGDAGDAPGVSGNGHGDGQRGGPGDEDVGDGEDSKGCSEGGDLRDGEDPGGGDPSAHEGLSKDGPSGSGGPRDSKDLGDESCCGEAASDEADDVDARAGGAARRAAEVLSALPAGTSAAAIAAYALRLREEAGEFPGCVTGVQPDGTVIHGNPTYRPPGSMQKHIRKRDRTCRFANCNRKAANCDIDHGISL